MALQMDRPRMINISDCSVQRPTNCDAPIHMTRTLLQENSPSEIPSQYTSHIVKYEVALMIHKALNAGLLRPGSARHEEIKLLRREVEELLEELPAPFRHPDSDTSWDILYPAIPKQRLQIRIILGAFLLALHRPHIVTDQSSLKVAVQAAKEVLDLSESLFETVSENQYKTFTLVFYVIEAGIFMAAALTRFELSEISHSDSHETFIERLERSVSRLEFLRKYHTVATAGKAIMTTCLDQLQSKLAKSNMSQGLRRSSIATPREEDVLAMQTMSTNAMDFDDEFWMNLLNDSAATSAWLDEYL